MSIWHHHSRSFHADRIGDDLAGEKVAAIITAFRIGPVLTDTILSLLDQAHVRLQTVLLVVDGCPDVGTTHAIAARFLAAYPGLFQVLWLENGGVSRARNRGLDWLLARHPDLDAIYCLDGDDIISRSSVATSLMALRHAQAREPERKFGWVVGNKLNFGNDFNYIETSTEFRKASYLSVNLSQPSCLYNADMFRDGVFWDEQMRTGIEDWEFWLAAIDKGYEGVFNPNELLYYRRLMGNRSSVNRRNDSYNIPYMRGKHARLFTPSALLEEEQERTPRYGFGVPWGDSLELTTDPGKPGVECPLDEVMNALGGRSQRNATRDYIFDPYAPDIACLIWSGPRDELVRKGLLRGLLMMAETKFSQGAGIVECLVEPLLERQQCRAGPQDDMVFSVKSPPAPGQGRESARSFFIVRLDKICPPGGRVPSLEALAAMTNRLLIRSNSLEAVQANQITYGQVQDFAKKLARFDADRTESRLGQAQIAQNRLHVSGQKISRHSSLTHSAIGTNTLFPQLPDAETTRFALVLPPEGAGAAIWEVMAGLRDRLGARARVSLFCPGVHLPRPPGDLARMVENVTSMTLWSNQINESPPGHSVGVPCWEEMAPPLIARLAGALAPFDHAICFELQAFAPVFLKLKSLGVGTICCEGLRDPDPDTALMTPRQIEATRRPDDPVAALNYASAYQRIVCARPERADVIAALGYPASRIGLGLEGLLEHVARAPREGALG